MKMKTIAILICVVCLTAIAGVQAEETGAGTVPWSNEDDTKSFSLPDELLADGVNKVIASGKVGKDAYWAIKTDGTLHIAGTGNMDGFERDYIFGSPIIPWAEYRNTITAAVVHDGITNIVMYTFWECPNLKAIEIGSMVNEIADVFYGKSGVEEINVNPLNETYTSAEGVLYNKDMTTLIAFPECKVFSGFSFPTTVTRIDSFARNGLQSIRIPDQVTQLGYSTFFDCRSLQEVVLSANLDKIEEQLFTYAYSLSAVTIPVNVTSIGQAAFYDCQALKDIYYQGTRNQWNQIRIERENEPLMTATIHFADETTFCALQDGEFVWNSLTSEIKNRIGTVQKSNIQTKGLNQNYQVRIPEDWTEEQQADGSRVYIGKDEEGNTAHLHFETEPRSGYTGNWSVGYPGAEVTSETINGINVNLVTNSSPFNEYVTESCWDKDNYYMICIWFDNNIPLLQDKLVDDAAYIIGSLSETGH